MFMKLNCCEWFFECATLPSERYACLVCGHRPVFDTVAVLSVHRKGKRHIQGTHNYAYDNLGVWSSTSNWVMFFLSIY